MAAKLIPPLCLLPMFPKCSHGSLVLALHTEEDISMCPSRRKRGKQLASQKIDSLLLQNPMRGMEAPHSSIEAPHITVDPPLVGTEGAAAASSTAAYRAKYGSECYCPEYSSDNDDESSASRKEGGGRLHYCQDDDSDNHNDSTASCEEGGELSEEDNEYEDEEEETSHFGTCTCGFPSKEGSLCRHMAVIEKSGVFQVLTQVNIMPDFWTTAHWQMQYPLELD
jgi:hypothetical protein